MVKQLFAPLGEWQTPAQVLWKKNNYNPKTILIHCGSRDLPNSVKKEDFTDLLEICYKSLESAEIHLFPIIYWKDYNNNVVEKFWKLLKIFPKYK